jgi:hypothetical protein
MKNFIQSVFIVWNLLKADFDEDGHTGTKSFKKKCNSENNTFFIMRCTAPDKVRQFMVE